MKKAKTFQPMLAEKADVETLRFPLIVQPKLDGIRCVIVNGQPMTRKLKPIPNNHIRRLLTELPSWDGEIMIPGKSFNDVQSAVMSEDGKPDFDFYVFDDFSDPNKVYEDRVRDMEIPRCPYIKQLKYDVVDSLEDLYIKHAHYVMDGYEGIMIRSLDSTYKFGRSTNKEQYLLKYKHFFDDEAIFVSVIEKMNNTNEKEVDERGYTKRSSKKEGKVPAGTAGTIIADWQGQEIKLGFGEGIDDKIKQDIWDNRDKHVGKKLTFRYQELSKDYVPRFGKFIGFRYDI